MKTKLKILAALLLLSTLNPQPAAFAQGTAFTYQGRLNNTNGPVTGTYDLTLTLFDASTGGLVIGPSNVVTGLVVTNGLFTVTPDFGSQFYGLDRWLEIAVRTNGGSAYSALSPRQKITPTPYSLYAPQAGTAITAMSVSADAIGASGLQSSSVTSDKIADSTITAADVNSASFSNTFWKVNGNAGADPANGAFLGTTDNLPVEIRVNGARALRLEPNTNGAPNVIGGSPSNNVAAAVEGATIAGGGLGLYPNQITASYATIGGGTLNTVAGGWSTIGGGRDINVTGSHSTVSGGHLNTIQINADYAAVGGGYFNTIQTNASFATIGGGKFNQATVNEATVAGGAFNSALAFSATIGGGGGNGVSGAWATISGGRDNQLTNADYATIGGGYYNHIQPNSTFATIGGGVANTIESNSYNAVIGGGHDNTIQSAAHSAISGGGYNTIQVNAYDSVIGGGGYNLIQTNAHSSFIGGGGVNSIQSDASYSTIGGGSQNTIQTNASYSTTGGGLQNTIQPNSYYSIIGGGIQNTIQTNSYYSAIGGGGANTIQLSAIGSTIGGGVYNTSAGFYSTVGGGFQNTNSSNYGTVGGGEQNTSGQWATVPGGSLNSAAGDYSFAAGRRAKANHTGAFVWADSTIADFASTANDQFLIRAGGGVGINKNNPATALDVNGTVTATGFSGSGASLISLNAASLTGTITDARLSANVALLNASQTFTGLNLFNNAANSFAGTFIGSGNGLTALNAAQLTSGTVPAAALGNAWQLGGNGGTTPGTHFLGTTDNQALELKANGARALRLEPNLNSPNLVGGSPGNVVTNGYYGAVIAGGGAVGAPNRVGGYFASVLGGYGNAAIGFYASVLGGSGNTASGNYSVAMGLNTTAQGLYSTAMGRLTVAANDDATAMGLGCSALGWDSVAMGTFSVAGGHYSLAAGYYSQATNQSAFVWSDSSATPGANSLANNSVTMRASGGYRLFSNSGSTAGVSLAPSGTAWAVISDRNVKKDFAAVDSVAILEKLAAMPITQWHYKWEEASVTPHIGPMAQDFKAAFYPGTDDKSITTQEADGVALAAIQGLNQKLEQKNAEIETLKQNLAALEKIVQSLVEKK